MSTAPHLASAPHLAIEGVRKLYGEVSALDDVSLSVGAHDYLVLLDPSGSGKTTLLSVIGGFLTEIDCFQYKCPMARAILYHKTGSV